MNLPGPVAELVDELASVRDVVAVVLGGSRALDCAEAGSDWDHGLYYRAAIDLTRLSIRGVVHPPGSWGRLMNGGAWLRCGSEKVDVLLRDLDVVEHWTQRAADGDFEVDSLLGYVAGIRRGVARRRRRGDGPLDQRGPHLMRTSVAFVCLSVVACGSAQSRQDPVPQGAPVIAASAAGQAMPAELAALAAHAKLEGAVAAWCRAEFRVGSPGAFAVAEASTSRQRYLALDADGRVTELGAFSGKPDLSCYTRADAETLNRSIGQSETIHGQIAPRWNTTVVCGFTDDTTAHCWQYSPVARTFVTVGGWTT